MGVPDLAELAAWLPRATLATTLAVVLVLALRTALRQRFGAVIAYGAWSVVPLALVGSLWPAREVANSTPLMMLPSAEPGTVVAAMPEAAFDPSTLLAPIWLFGCIAMLAWFAFVQMRFLRGLRAVQVAPGLQRADSCAGLPAVVGVMRPRIVLPADFTQRFDAVEQALLLAHERAHILARDPWTNAAALLLRCLFWFNPVFHVAAARFRHDQELACDQRVIAGHPEARRAYGEAMLKTLMAAQPVPLGCHWGITHPLKERIMMLKQTTPSLRTRRLGTLLIVLAGLGAGVAAWAAKPARIVAAATPQSSSTATPAAPRPAGDFLLDIGIGERSDALRNARLLGRYGNAVSIELGANGVTWNVAAEVSPLANAHYVVQADIRRNGVQVAKPRLTVEAGKPASIQLDGAGGTRMVLQLRVGTQDEVRATNQSVAHAIGTAKIAANAAATSVTQAAVAQVDAELPDVTVHGVADPVERATLQRELATALRDAERANAAASRASQLDAAQAAQAAQEAARAADVASHAAGAVEATEHVRIARDAQAAAAAATVAADVAARQAQRDAVDALRAAEAASGTQRSASAAAGAASDAARHAIQAASQASRDAARARAKVAALDAADRRGEVRWTSIDLRHISSQTGDAVLLKCDVLKQGPTEHEVRCGNLIRN